MTENVGNQSEFGIGMAKKALEEARASGDQARVSVALCNLGFAMFQADQYSEGKKHFREADTICRELDDYQLTLKCLSTQAFAYHNTGQLPTAFEIAQKIQKMAEEQNAPGWLIDALATQGQVLIDSRDEIQSLEKFNAALELAEEIKDQPRKMKVLGALGHYSLTIASPDQAESYFTKAYDLARVMGDKQSEIGYYGNIGIVLEWKKKWSEAAQIFTEVMAYLKETDNVQAQLQPLYHLVNIAEKQKDDQQVIEHALEGIETAKEVEEYSLRLIFYEKLAAAYFRLGLKSKAEEYLAEAVEAAHNAADQEKEVSFRLSLGESYLLDEKYEDAMEVYQGAQKAARRLNQHDKEAYAIGRIGVCLAELGRSDQAIHHHQIASKVASEINLDTLEAEQLVMLAIIYRDLQQPEKALDYANQSLVLYRELELEAEIANIQALISELTEVVQPEKNGKN